MSKAQVWIAVFLGIFIVLFLINQSTEEEKFVSKSEEISSKSNSNDIAKILEDQNCYACHGANLQGTSLGPSLENIKKYWKNSEELANYLSNPDKFMHLDRFKEYKKQFKTIMPPYNTLSREQLIKICDYLLSR